MGVVDPHKLPVFYPDRKQARESHDLSQCQAAFRRRCGAAHFNGAMVRNRRFALPISDRMENQVTGVI